MMHLQWPWVLAALPLPLLVRFLLPAAKIDVQAALRLPFFRELPGAAQTIELNRALWLQLLAWLVWILLVAAAARPQWLGDPVRLPVTGRDLMLAVDVSGSMESADYELNGRAVSRLDLVKAVAGRFIERRQGDRLGLILFGSQAYVQTPLTYDRATVRAFLNDSVIGLAGRETAVGDALALAIKRLREQPEDNRVLILLTDGASTAGNIDPLDAAKLAAEAGVRVYTVGIGGGPVGVRTAFGMRLRRPAGDLDLKTLRSIADMTQGRFFHATDTDELEQVYAELDRLEPSVRDERSYRPVTPLYFWPAGLALLLSAGLALFKVLDRGGTRREATEEKPHGGA